MNTQISAIDLAVNQYVRGRGPVFKTGHSVLNHILDCHARNVSLDQSIELQEDMKNCELDDLADKIQSLSDFVQELSDKGHGDLIPLFTYL